MHVLAGAEGAASCCQLAWADKTLEPHKTHMQVIVFGNLFQSFNPRHASDNLHIYVLHAVCTVLLGPYRFCCTVYFEGKAHNWSSVTMQNSIAYCTASSNG